MAITPEFGILLQRCEKCLTGQLRRQSFVPSQRQYVKLHIPEILPVDRFKILHSLTSFTY